MSNLSKPLAPMDSARLMPKVAARVEARTGHVRIRVVERSRGRGASCRNREHDGGVTQLIGREREAAALELALQRALSRAGGAVAVSGEPGIGKTTLARTQRLYAEARGVPVLWGRGVESGAPVFWPWRQPVLGRMEMIGDEELRAEVGRGAAELARIVPELGARLGVDPAPVDGDRVPLFDAFAGFLGAAAEANGLLVVLDDMHWADLASLRLVEHIVEDLASSRVLLLITYRAVGAKNEVLAILDGVRTITRVVLRGLPVEAVDNVLANASGHNVPATISATVHEVTGGNPLFVSELARLLTEDVAAGRAIDGSWPRQVPETVRALIRRRLLGLTGETQTVLRAAAVLGREFAVAVVAAMVGAPALVCLEALDEARAGGFVEPSAVPGRAQFVHALVRDAVLVDLTAAEQMRLHRAAAGALEAAVDREVRPSAVAGHLAAAMQALPTAEHNPAEALRAADWAVGAADEAMRRLAWEDAAQFRRLALELTSGVELDDPVRCELTLGLAEALTLSGDLAGGLAACTTAADLARRSDRPDLLGRAALVLQGVGDPVLSRDIQRLAEDALAALGDGSAATRSRLLAQLAEAHLYRHDERAADRCSRESLAEAETAGDRDTLLLALRARRLATLAPDAAGETLALADRVLRLAIGRTRADIRHAFWAHQWRVQAWLVRGQLDLVADELEQLAVCAEELREPLTGAHLLRARAILASARGQFTQALDLGEAAQAAFRRSGQATAAGQHAAFRCSVGRFAGYPPDLAEALAVPVDAAGPFAGLGRVRSVLVLSGLGRTSDAAAQYRRLDPVATWRLPRYLQLTAWTLRLRAAVALAVPFDVAGLVELLAPHRGLHAGGGLSYDGPVELALGMGAAALGQLDAAETDLTAALRWSRTHHARPFLVEAAIELAGVHARRAGPADTAIAGALLDEAAAIASQLHMPPFIVREQRLRMRVGLDRTASGLSARETQVAQLVARGLTNRQIAETLVLSERTAGNHVQHILTKLGLHNRTQIAAWVGSTADQGIE